MEKDAIRRRVWARLQEEGAARFPLPLEGRIPNFVGAEEAARRLQGADLWQDARRLKANPDSPQRPVRQAALQAGKVLYMAVPRLRQARCFLELSPKRIPNPSRAASIRGAFALGRPVRPERVEPLDLVLAGSVAVDGRGGRVGKGGGYSDLEYALGRTFGFLTEATPVVTTVHPLQVVDHAIPMGSHDIPVDLVATPKEVLVTRTAHPRPPGILWDLLPEAKRAAIPVLQELWSPRREG